MQRLGGVVLRWPWLTHGTSIYNGKRRLMPAGTDWYKVTFKTPKSNSGKNLVIRLIILTASFCGLAACGPRAHIPALPVPVPGAVSEPDPAAQLARSLAPVLHVQRDEWFDLSRIVAVVHPTRPIIAYHLLWRDDVNGSGIPFTVPTDEEIVWVGYDSTTREATDMWTYWHGKILHTDWRGHGSPAVNVQWGKHGSLPRGVVESDLPSTRKMNVFYAFTWITLPDIWLGQLTRRGPWCFCHGYARYRDFSRVMPIADSLNAIVRTEDPTEALLAVFGRPYSKKNPWPE
jgi:hypothetical protein